MKIQRLKIENFRGIREMEIDFHPRLNVNSCRRNITERKSLVIQILYCS